MCQTLADSEMTTKEQADYALCKTQLYCRHYKGGLRALLSFQELSLPLSRASSVFRTHPFISL